MQNVIYNKFTELFIKGLNEIGGYEPIDLDQTDTYKIAILNSLYEPKADDIYSFYDLKNSGYEVTDLNESYEEGGSYITFTRLGKNKESDTTIKYSAGTTRWTNTKISSACSAIIYREDDGLLISCHMFDDVFSTDGDDILLDWKDIPTLIIKNMAEDDIVTVDHNISVVSDNPVASRTLANLFKDLGVVFTDDLGGSEEDYPYPKEVPNILPEDEYVKAPSPFDPEQTYYIESSDGTYIRVEEPIEEDLEQYYIFYKSYSDDWANSLTYVTTLKSTNIDDIFSEVVEED